MEAKHLTIQELETGLDEIYKAPKEQGVLKMIVRRPEDNEREVLQEGMLDVGLGLTGDNWKTRGSKHTSDKLANPDMQINIMNSRVIALIAQDESRWQLAGDQFFIDMDLSIENLPAGTQLKIGEAILEVTAQPHSGCSKFSARYGVAAMKFVNSPVGKELRLRGINAKVIQSGKVRVGDVVTKAAQ